MMTTESMQVRRSGAGPVLLGAASTAAVVGVGLAVVGLLTEGGAAGRGALAGTALVVVVFGLGALAVDLVAGRLPALSLLVAVTTYALQVVVMAAVFSGLTRSGLLEGALDRRWLGATVVVATLAWLSVQIGLSLRIRIPAYDLPEPRPTGGEA